MGKIIMSRKERKCLPVLEKLKHKEITQKAAAKQLNLTTRQIRNKVKRYLKEGTSGIVHKNRGKPSPKRTSDDIRNEIITLMNNKNFEDWGPTMITERLMKKSIEICRETTRQIMISEGFWRPKRDKISKYRKQRERKEYFGEFVQFDGSEHAWLENRASKCTLLLFIDDATSAILWAGFYPSESTNNVMHVSNAYFQKWGKPISLYTDYGSVYKVNVNNRENTKKTQYERALKELDIGIAHARSPQAKGRVERCFGVLQDRLIKELRIEGISTYDKANKYLQEVYIPDHNRRRSVDPKYSGDLHRPIEKKLNLNYVLCRKEQRVLRNDFTLQYKRKNLQLEREQKRVIRPKEKITVAEHLDGSITLWKRGAKLNYHEIIERKPIAKEKVKIKTNDLPKRPPQDHPWRQRLWPDRRYLYGRQ